MKRLLTAIVVVGLLLISNSPVSAYYTNMPASVVIGQTNFTDSVGGTGNSKFFDNTPSPNNTGLAGIFVDPNHRLIVSDFSNSRVLIWNSVPTTNGVGADLVLGQPDFNTVTVNTGGRSASSMQSPEGVYSTGTRLVVADTVNNRVLIWNTFPTQNGQAADVVVGQSDFNSTVTTCNSSTMWIPDIPYIYQDKLVVTDRNHHRVLVWNSIPTQNGQAADMVIGKNSLADCSDFSTVNASNLSNPIGLFVGNDGKLFVTQTLMNRILIWNTFPTQNGQAADVVVGQANFTGSSAGTSASTFNSPASVFVNNRMFVTDEKNHRVLIWNSVPTTNGASADLVLGQPNFTSGSANQGGSTAANTFNKPRSTFIYNNKLFVGDPINARVLIFNNVISSPQMNIDLPLTSLPNGNLRVYGNVLLGERGTYGLQSVKAEVNGQGLGNVSYLGSGRDDGTGLTRYEFFNDFNPGGIANSDVNNFTLLLQASSFNADTSNLFYFQPFKLNSLSNNTFNFSVNKYQIQKIKDNVDHFEVLVKKSNSNENYTQYISNISPNLIDTNTGQVAVNLSSSGISFPNVVPPGIYDIKVRAVSRNSGWGEDSNIVSAISLTGVGTGGSVTRSMVLQINSIDGNSSILSTFNPGSIKTNYQVTGFNPAVRGISWANSLITLNITNKNNTNEFKTYTTRVNSDSSFTLTPSLYTNSILNFTVTKDGMYNFIPSFNVNQR